MNRGPRHKALSRASLPDQDRISHFSSSLSYWDMHRDIGFYEPRNSARLSLGN